MPREGGFTGGGHVVEHVASLHSQGGHHSQDALHEAAAVWAVRAEAGFSPHHAVTHALLGGVVRQLDPGRAHQNQRKNDDLDSLATVWSSLTTEHSDMSCGRSRGMAPLIEHFASLPDPRVVGRSDHKLLDIIAIAILGTICGAEGWDDFAEFGEYKEKWLRTFLGLPAGIPSADTFRRVLSALDPEAFSACFVSWMQALVDSTDGKLVVIDGKTARRSFSMRCSSARRCTWSALGFVRTA